MNTMCVKSGKKLVVQHAARAKLQAWVDQRVEEVIEPDLPIIDAHHHLRDWRTDGGTDCYLFEDLLDDVSSSHNILATVVVECYNNMYRTDGPPELRSLGETEFLTGIGAMFSSGRYGPTLACAGIVGNADLKLGKRVGEVLDAHVLAAGGRFRGIRNSVAWDASATLKTPHVDNPGVMSDPAFREGFACLAPRNLSFDVWAYHPQLPIVLDLARAFPDTTLVVNHCGGPVAIGPYAGKRDEVFAFWSAQLRELAKCPNVVLKLGALGSPRTGFGFETRPMPPSSEEIAQAWRPYVETCIDIFGPQRCIFESNFPPDKVSCSYGVFWNAFKRIAARYSEAEKTALFRETAARIYRLEHVLPGGRCNAQG